MHKVQREPYITRTPHDRRLIKLSEKIQKHLGHRCEIEYVVSEEGQIYVVQAKDISHIETLEQQKIRRNHNYRERPVYVMDNKEFYLEIIGKCEDLIFGDQKPRPNIEAILEIITNYQNALEDFALRHHRFGILGLSIQEPEELYQIANHYLDDLPDLQTQLSKALNDNLYNIDYFLSSSGLICAATTPTVSIRFAIPCGPYTGIWINTIKWSKNSCDWDLKPEIRSELKLIRMKNPLFIVYSAFSLPAISERPSFILRSLIISCLSQAILRLKPPVLLHCSI
jgi:hypothetical protein